MRLRLLLPLLLTTAVILLFSFFWHFAEDDEIGDRPPAHAAPGGSQSDPAFPASAGEASPPQAPPQPDTLEEEKPSARLQLALGELERAAPAGEREELLEAARRLRQLLIEKPDLLEEAERALTDPQNGLGLRQALGVIMGSVPGERGKAAVLRALKLGVEAGLERSLIFALNIVPEESPPVFRRDDQPYAVKAAPGLVVFVRGEVESEEARQVLGRRLAAPDDAVRFAAARVLRDSMAFAEVREAMRDRLSEGEDDAEVRAEAAAALAQWSKRETADPDERSAVLGELLTTLAESEEVVRFRLTSPLAQAPLSQDELSRLRLLATDPADEVRRTAVEILGRRLPGSADGERTENIETITNRVSDDTDPAVRETGALWLRHASGNVKAVESLLDALVSDPHPEVRAAAVASLALFDSFPEAREVIGLTRRSDPDPLVRAAAERALGRRSR